MHVDHMIEFQQQLPMCASRDVRDAEPLQDFASDEVRVSMSNSSEKTSALFILGLFNPDLFGLVSN